MLHRLIWVYPCQNVTLFEITYHSSNDFYDLTLCKDTYTCIIQNLYLHPIELAFGFDRIYIQKNLHFTEIAICAFASYRIWIFILQNLHLTEFATNKFCVLLYIITEFASYRIYSQPTVQNLHLHLTKLASYRICNQHDMHATVQNLHLHLTEFAANTICIQLYIICICISHNLATNKICILIYRIWIFSFRIWTNKICIHLYRLCICILQICNKQDLHPTVQNLHLAEFAPNRICIIQLLCLSLCMF